MDIKEKPEENILTLEISGRLDTNTCSQLDQAVAKFRMKKTGQKFLCPI